MENLPVLPEFEDSKDQPLAPGLYLVATPIGNLEDITLRALRVLRSCDRIACEDTRQTRKLLNHFSISTPALSCHEHNERERAVELIAAMREGQRVALVSDAGMPGISDPGTWLVRAALEANVRVYPIPGANAALTALVASGLPTRSFRFLGFLPEKSGARRTALEAIAASQPATADAAEPETLIFHEAPHRILDTLQDMRELWGEDLQVVVARELTKQHEEFLRGTVSAVLQQLAAMDRVRGEITLLVSTPHRISAEAGQDLLAALAGLQTTEGLSEKDALKQLARQSGRSKSELYRELQRQRASSRTR